MTNPSEQLAAQLLARAVGEEQAVHQLGPDDDAAAVRAHVRRLARRQGVGIRTGVLQGALVVVRADASVWGESAAQMRAKLTP